MTGVRIGVTIDAHSVPDLIDQLQGLLGGLEKQTAAAAAAESTPGEPRRSRRKQAEEAPVLALQPPANDTAAEAPAEALVESTPAAQPAEAPAEQVAALEGQGGEGLVGSTPAAQPTAHAHGVTFETVRDRLGQVQAKRKLAGVIDLLIETTGERKLSNVDPSKYPDVLQAADRVLGEIA